MISHAIPPGDLLPHEESVTCHCDPVIIDVESGGQICIHNSFRDKNKDWLEAYEKKQLQKSNK